MVKRKPKKCGWSKCDKLFLPYFSTEKTCRNYVCQSGFLADTNSEKAIKERVKQFKQNTTKLSVYEARAKTVFQRWVRIRDKDFPCISCGTNDTPQWDGGHYYKAEIYSGIIFNEMNVNKQCCFCNDHQAGNLIEYRKGLIFKYGILAVEGLDELANEKRNYKYTRDELVEITKKYKLKIQSNEN